MVLSSRNLVPGLGDLEGEIPPRAIEFGIIMWLCVLIPSLNINYLLFSNGISTQNHIIMKNNIWKYIRSCPGMPAVVKFVAYESKANVTAYYENIKIISPSPLDQCRSASSHSPGFKLYWRAPRDQGDPHEAQGKGHVRKARTHHASLELGRGAPRAPG